MKRLLIFLLALLLTPVMALAVEAVPMDDLDWVDPDQAANVPEGTLQFGDSGASVLQLQTRLTELAYYSGAISGEFGAGTRTALESFQADFDLPVTGIADPDTQDILLAAQYRPLRYGSQGQLVKNLQTRLLVLGFYGGKISGNYLTATLDAVTAFQAKNGLIANGVADPDTQAILYDRNARGYNDSPLPAATPAPVKEPSFLVDESSEAFATPAPTVAFTKIMKYGDASPEVKVVQARLTDLGFYEGPISGNYLGHTRNAVKAFQEHHAMEADGIMGESTWNLLFNDDAVLSAEESPRPTPAPTPVPFAITVDVTNQVTTVYTRDEYGDYTVVVRQMLCSTGTKGYPSDVGEFVLTGRRARWCDFPQWGGHAQYWTKINESIAFHSVVYNTVDTMDLSVKSYNNLGKRASHGCIRLTVADARWIYNNCGAGTVVTITEDLPSDPELKAALKLPALNKEYMLPYVTAQPTAAPVYVSGAQPPLPLTTLKKNQTSPAVYWLQSKLKEEGYYTGTVTGTYLDGTVKAVKAFQKANGLSVTGTANVQTLELLYADELSLLSPAPQ
ncbi:MAG: hypothetical protein E7333_03785 [Clostridiales bacterium]|nr:hypothetical protein [Clostridiales bacterium]